MKYINKESLKGHILHLGDIVDLNGIEYEVKESYLNSTVIGKENDLIFESLGIFEPEKRYIAEDCYGYKPMGGVRPEFIDGDYVAAQRLVLKLYDLIDEKFNTTNVSYTESIIDKIRPNVGDTIMYIGECEVDFTKLKKYKVDYVDGAGSIKVLDDIGDVRYLSSSQYETIGYTREYETEDAFEFKKGDIVQYIGVNSSGLYTGDKYRIADIYSNGDIILLNTYGYNTCTKRTNIMKVAKTTASDSIYYNLGDACCVTGDAIDDYIVDACIDGSTQGKDTSKVSEINDFIFKL